VEKDYPFIMEGIEEFFQGILFWKGISSHPQWLVSDKMRPDFSVSSITIAYE
jgi:hypothetical protein